MISTLTRRGMREGGVINPRTGPRPFDPNTGLVWFDAVAPVVATWRDVGYGNGILVGVATGGAGNRAMRSTNGGSAWVAVASGDDALEWQAVAYSPDNLRWASLSGNSSGDERRVMTSDDDGATWTKLAQVVASTRYRRLIWIDAWDLFFGVGDGGGGAKLIRSTTGATGNWTTYAAPANVAFPNGCAFSPSLARLLIMSDEDTACSFADANPPTAWTNGGALPAGHVWHNVFWSSDHSLFVAVGTIGGIATSPTGAVWTDRSVAGVSLQWEDGLNIPGTGRLVIVGTNSAAADRVAVSDDAGVTWTMQSIPDETIAINGITLYEPSKRLVALAGSGAERILTSPT